MGLSWQAAWHATGGVPRLYAAALRAGLGPVGAARVVVISAAAAAAAAEHGPGVPGRQNALRHFGWQAVLAAEFGAELAHGIAAAQEIGTSDAHDSRVDRDNNAVGRAYGVEHSAELTRLSVRAALDRLTEVGLEKWESDELRWVRPR